MSVLQRIGAFDGQTERPGARRLRRISVASDTSAAILECIRDGTGLTDAR